MPQCSVTSRRDVFLVYLLFFFSGFSSLTLQVAWTKILGQTIGIDYFSQIVVVSVFMIGLGLGGLAGVIVSRWTERPALFFALAELLIAAFAMASPTLLRAAQGASLALSSALRGHYLSSDFIVYLALLVAPVTLMGASLPIVVRVLERRIDAAGALVGRVYAVNILGAMIGTLTSGIVLIGVLGISRTIYVAAAINLALSALVAWRMRGRIAADVVQVRGWPKPSVWHAVAFLVGFISIGYEMLFLRTTGYYFGATSYVFPIALAAFLFWLFVGTRSAGFVLDRGFDPHWLLSQSLALAVLSTAVAFVMPQFMQGICGDDFIVISRLKETARLPDFLGMAAVVTSMMLPVCFLSCGFPALVQIAGAGASAAEASGRIYFIQTIGNFLGAVVTGSLLVVHLGTRATFLVFCAAMAAMALYSAQRVSKRLTLATCSVAAIAIPIIIMLAVPFYRPFERPGRPLARVSEQLEGTAMIYEDEPNRYGASNFLGAEPATSYNYDHGEGPQGVTCAWPLNVGLAQLTRAPKRVLIIGIGTGDGAVALHKLYPEAQVYVVELLDVVIREMRQRGHSDLRKMLADADVSVMDGGRFVKQNAAALKGSFDFVQIGILHVTASGSGDLFTHEFLQQVRDIMTSDGVLTFNAYPGAVKSAMELFSNVAISSWGRAMVADVFLWNGKSDNPLVRLRRYDAALAGRSVDACVPATGFLITNRSRIANALVPITLQTNDQVASENFLFTRTDVYTEKEHYRLRSCFAKDVFTFQSTDLRKWPSALADCDHACLVKADDDIKASKVVLPTTLQ